MGARVLGGLREGGCAGVRGVLRGLRVCARFVLPAAGGLSGRFLCRLVGEGVRRGEFCVGVLRRGLAVGFCGGGVLRWGFAGVGL